jgi:phage terminase large subunit GpA-like protein
LTSLLESPQACETLANALRWERWETLSEWAESRIVLPAKTPAPGPLDLSVTPYGRQMLDCLLYPWTQKVTIIAGSQMFKTLLEIIFVCYIIDQHPTNGLFLMPRDVDAKEIAIERIKPVIKESPLIARYVTAEKAQVTQSKISLNGATIFFASAGVASELAQRSIEFGFADETRDYKDSVGDEGAVLDLLDGRLENYPGSLRVDTSTPTDQHAISWRQYEAGSMHVWKEPCIHCNFFQELVLAQIKHPDNVQDYAQINDDKLAWYECVECGGRIDERDKAVMLSRGKWFQTTKSPRPSHYSFRISGISSPWRNFGNIKARFMEAKSDREKLRAFMNTVCGVNFEERKAGLNKHALEIATKDDGSLLRGQVPDDAIRFAIGCDWHGLRKGLFWVAVAFTPGPELWIVDYGNVFSEEDLLNATLLRDWSTVSGKKVTPKIGVDSGWEPADVYDYARPYYPHIRPTKGDDVNVDRASSLQERPVDYTVTRGGVEKRYSGFKRLHIRTEYYKDRLAAMLTYIFRAKLRIEEAEKDKDADDGGSSVDMSYTPRFHLCRNADDDFISQLSSEHKILVKKKHMWVPKKEGAENHYLDCAVGAWAIADLYGLSRMSTKAKKKEARAETAHQKVPKRKSDYLRGLGENMNPASSRRRGNRR